YEDEKVLSQIQNWMLSAIGYAESQAIKVARFGDNMRNVAVTAGDKVEAAIQFGWTVDYFGIGDLVEEMDQVTEEEIQEVYEEIQEVDEAITEPEEMTQGDSDPECYEKQVKEQIKIEIGLKSFLDKGGYTAFTTNFEDLHGMKQLPGMAVQRLNAQRYGFAGEGDWKTAALDRLVKAITQNTSTGFMEDYTY